MGRRVGHRRCRIVNGIKNKNMKNSLGAKFAPRIKTARCYTAKNP